MDRVIQHFDKEQKVAPIHIDMGIAKFCNVKCVFCYGLKQTPSPVFIEREALLQTIEDAAEIGVRSIAIIGDGEPTCSPYLYEALTLGKTVGLDLAVSTNGVLLNMDDKIKTVLNSCSWMRFCLGAGDKNGYIKIHGKDYFNIVKKNVERTVELKHKYGYTCDIGLQTVFIPNFMEDDVLKESKFAIESGVDYFVIKQCSLPDDGKSGMYKFDINEYDKSYVDECLKECEAMSTDKTEITPKWNTIKQKGIRPYDGCLSVPLISEISGNGNWFPCGYFFDDKPEHAPYKFGNIQEKSLKEIFNSEHYWEVIERMKKFNVHKDCHGACRLDATNKFCYDYLDRPMGINFI